MEGYFRIVTPVYNAEEYIVNCIKSLQAQTDEKWTQIIVDDCSTDNTYEAACKAAEGDDRITIIRNEERMGHNHNHQLIHTMFATNSDKDDVFVHVDGDDWLLFKESLEHVRSVYSNNDVWATYGNYVSRTGNSSNCREVNLEEGIRHQILKRWPFSHLRTFKVFLWDYVEESDLQDSEGNPLTAAIDAAILCPVLEKCGNRIAFIKDPLYFYNDDTGNNMHQVRLQEQVRCAYQVAAKPAKEKL